MKVQSLHYVIAWGMAAALVSAILALSGGYLWVALGGGAWLAGVWVKVGLIRLLRKVLARLPPEPKAGALGLVSGVAEMGVAGLIWEAVDGGRVEDLLVFSLSAGATEFCVLLVGTLLRPPAPALAKAWNESSKTSAFVWLMMPIERAVAVAAHLGARGLVCLGLMMVSVPMIVAGVFGFSLIDGLAALGMVRKWDWFDAALCKRFFGGIGAIALAMVVALLAVVARS